MMTASPFASVCFRLLKPWNRPARGMKQDSPGPMSTGFPLHGERQHAFHSVNGLVVTLVRVGHWHLRTHRDR